MSVRMVINSAVTGADVTADNRAWVRGDCASRTFRTLVINFLGWVSIPGHTPSIGNLLLVYRSARLNTELICHTYVVVRGVHTT